MPTPAKRFAICTDENRPGPSNQRPTSPKPKMKTPDEDPSHTIEEDDENKENIAPDGYQQPSYHSRRTSGILVDAEGFETAPILQEADFEDDDDEEAANGDEDDLGVTPIEETAAPAGRAASTPTKNRAPDITWRVTEILSGNMQQLIGDESSSSSKLDASDRRLSTILEASKESGSSGSSNSLGTPSVGRLTVNGSGRASTSMVEDSMPTLGPIVSDPFNPALRNKLILGSKLPYETITENLPSMKKKCILQYPNGYRATIVKLIGEGGFAKVYFAQRELDDDEEEETRQEMTTCIVREDHAAIKVTHEITAGLWEFYILRTIFNRLSRQQTLPCIKKSIPEPHCAAYYTNGFVISMPYLPYGSLVDMVNRFNKEVPELLARYLTIELMVIVMRLHERGILHGDMKPDNVLFRKIPSIQMIGDLRLKTQCLCLIDFGQAIDLEAFPSSKTTFSHVVNEDIQKCVAMREDRDWLFDFDWFGVANCAHTLLFGEYIDVEKTPSGDYAIKKIIELGGASMNNRESMRTLSLKLIQLNSLLQNRH